MIHIFLRFDKLQIIWKNVKKLTVEYEKEK